VTFLVIIAEGKFQGVIKAAGPTGWRRAINFLCPNGDCNTSPLIRFASSE